LLQPFSGPSSEERDNPSQFLSGGMSQVFTRAINGQLRRAVPTGMSQKQRPHESSSEREGKREQNQLGAGQPLLLSPWPNLAAPHSAFALSVPWPATVLRQLSCQGPRVPADALHSTHFSPAERQPGPG